MLLRKLNGVTHTIVSKNKIMLIMTENSTFCMDVFEQYLAQIISVGQGASLKPHDFIFVGKFDVLNSISMSCSALRMALNSLFFLLSSALI